MRTLILSCLAVLICGGGVWAQDGGVLDRIMEGREERVQRRREALKKLFEGEERAGTKRAAPAASLAAKKSPPPEGEGWTDMIEEWKTRVVNERGEGNEWEVRPRKPMMGPLIGSEFRERYGRRVEVFYGTIKRLKDELGLSDRQSERLDGMLFDFQVAGAKKKMEVYVLGLELRRDLKSSPPDFVQGRKRLEAMYEVIRVMSLTAYDAVAKAYEVLTPEQRKKLGKILS